MLPFRLAIALTATISSNAFAQPRLISSIPVANASLAKQSKIQLNFNEKISVRSMRIALVMTGMPGMADHPPMPMNVFSLQMSPDGKGVALLLKKALPLGSYAVNWQVSGTANEPAKGTLNFVVK